MKKLYLVFAFVSIVSACGPGSGSGPVSTEEKSAAFIDSLLAVMTLEEKIGQMNQYSSGPHITGPAGEQDGRYQRFVNGQVGSVLNVVGAEETYKMQKLVMDSTRLGIPLIFAYDVIHGYKTIFPVPLGESASWDLGVMEESARIAAKESAAAGLQWTFAPMVDISRDARWGRVMEGAGEDPYLGSRIAEARVRGLQGSDLSDVETIAACAKHMAGYGFAESGKDYNTVLLGNYDLHNYVLPPFKTATDAGVATFMNAFNDIDGVPSTANSWLIDDLLRGQWNFDGLVVSDWNSIGELENHGVAANRADAAALALKAGTDIDMEADAYVNDLEKLIEENRDREQLINVAVRRILKLKYDLGLFDDPYRYMDKKREAETLLHESHLEAARDIGRKSIVLLKNEDDLLPLSPSTRSIGIIGPLAKDKDAPLGNWRAQGEANSAVSFYEGMVAAVGKSVQINYAEGCKLSIGPNAFHLPVEINEKDKSGFAEAVRVARSSEIVFMVLGEPAHMSGEARSRANIGLPGVQLELLKEVYKSNKKIVLVLMNGRPLTIPWEAENIPSILETWYLGSETGNAIADVVTGAYNPSGKLTMSFPRAVGQVPIYYNYRSTGRPQSDLIFYQHHMDVERSPQFPFGFGLSYTTFKISEPEITNWDEKVTVKISVENTGERAGKETVQLYVRDLVSTIARPVRELKAFKQVELDPGQGQTVTFELSRDDLSFYDRNGRLTFEPGEFEIFVGANSRDLSGTVVRVD